MSMTQNSQIDLQHQYEEHSVLLTPNLLRLIAVAKHLYAQLPTCATTLTWFACDHLDRHLT